MKKFFYLLMAAATLSMASCDKDDDDIVEPDYDSYIGTMTTSAGYGDPYDMLDANIYAKVIDGETDKLTITLNNALFHTMMEAAIPGGINIVMPNIPEISDDTYYAASVDAQNKVGDSYGDRFQVTELTAIEGDDSITITFSVAIDASLFSDTFEEGALYYNFTVAYSGIEQ